MIIFAMESHLPWMPNTPFNQIFSFGENTWNSNSFWREVTSDGHWLLCHIGSRRRAQQILQMECSWLVAPFYALLVYHNVNQKMAPYSGLARILVVLHNTLVAPGNLHDNSSPTGRSPPNWNVQFLKSFLAAKRMLEELRNWNRNLGGGWSAVGGFNPHCNLDISRGTGPCTSLAWLTVSSSTAALPS